MYLYYTSIYYYIITINLDKLLYIHSSSNHPPQIIKQLPNSISKRLSKNSSNQKIFNIAKVEYEDALKN